MVFSSLLFLFRFFPAAFLLYYLTPRRLKNFVLLLLSLVFYAWGEPRYVAIMFLSIAIDYTAGRGIEWFRARGGKAGPRLCLAFSLCGNLGLLAFFKYSNFILENFSAVTGLPVTPLAVTLPLGISFYTFQTLSYTIDVYRGNVPAEHNLIDFGAFVCLFPQLIAGPIVKYSDINRELKRRTLSLSQVESGAATFLLGLGSKVLLANNAGMLWDDVQAIGFDRISAPLAWLGAAAFGLQIYFDFSGYSLMAIGLGRMLGFEFPQNFNFPYTAKSVAEFWRRWHMTLSSWFREYVYIPLGGNRHGTARTVRNLFLVWAATGLWHGASWNFLFWGLFFFVFLVLEKWVFPGFAEKHPAASRLFLLFLLLLSWMLFAIPDLSALASYYQAMFSLRFSADILYYLRNYGAVLALAAVFATPGPRMLWERLRLPGKGALRVLGLAAVLAASTAYLVDATYNPFLYFRF